MPETGLTERLVAMSAALRRHGLAVGTSDIADAGRAVRVLGLDDRERLRTGLASALLRRSGERAVFDQVFDLYFPAALGARTDHQPELPEGDERDVSTALRDLLADALARHDAEALDRLAALTLERLGALDRQPGWSAAQALDRLAPQTAIADALERRSPGSLVGDGEGGATSTSGGGSEGSGGGSGSPRFEDRFERDELRSAIAEFRRSVEAEARRRNAEVRGTERIADYAVRNSVETRDFLSSGSKDLEELRATIHPLAKRLAARLSSRRRAQSRGQVDVRKTLRRSLSTGGIPIDPAYAHRRPHRPDLVLLCDISGSVAGFSAFTMALMQALSTQFRRLRVFAFVSTTDEITDLVLDADRLADDVVTTALRTRKVLGWGAGSSYGQALDSFTERHLDAVGPRTTVLILGDARSNYGLPRHSALQAIRDQARQVVWLNPEPVRSWDTGDSIAGQYSGIVDMHECRNVEQLRTFVGRTLAV
ncbi:VWA domain-containing protein [Demetria terragena]|uniref:VWA domain-containing protein n=1 Tax=Demetria terragena TaxID=63959 RepID=UPI00037449E5|nr:VWA domain-containing protein [Demetria terragena]